MYPTLTTALFSLLPLTLAANIPITVGDGATSALMFNPSVVPADVGDTLTFSYYPRNHSVVQSSFANPCHPLASGGFFSGFQPLSAGPGPVEFVVQVNDTNPIWIYCSQTKGSHCQNGMAMVVNEPDNSTTLAAYQLAAANTGNSTSPHRIAGGIFVSRNSTSTSGRNSTASSTGSSSIASSSSSSHRSPGTGSSSGTGSGAGSNSVTKSGSGSSTSSSSTSSNTSQTSTTIGTSQTSPIVRFKGAASKTVTEFSIFGGAAALVVFSLL